MTAEPLSLLTDAELQARIERSSARLIEAEARYEKRRFAIKERGERDRWWIELRTVEKERSRRQRAAAAREREVGLA